MNQADGPLSVAVWCFAGLSARTLRCCFRRQWRRFRLCVRWPSSPWPMKAMSWYTITDDPSPVPFWPVHLGQNMSRMKCPFVWTRQIPWMFKISLCEVQPSFDGLVCYPLETLVCAVGPHACMLRDSWLILIDSSCIMSLGVLSTAHLGDHDLSSWQYILICKQEVTSNNYNSCIQASSCVERLQPDSEYEAPLCYEAKPHDELILSPRNPLLSERGIGCER